MLTTEKFIHKRKKINLDFVFLFFFVLYIIVVETFEIIIISENPPGRLFCNKERLGGGGGNFVEFHFRKI